MSGGLHSLATVMKRCVRVSQSQSPNYNVFCPSVIHRLEAATSRLEDLADEQSRRSGRAVSDTSSSSFAPAPAPPAPPPPPPPPELLAAAAEDPPSVTAYDELVIDGKLKTFVELTQGLGSEALVEQVASPLLDFQGIHA